MPPERPTFDAVYREHWRFVWRSARRLGVPAERVDDVVQDVFLVVHDKLATFEGRSKLRTWLYAITHRTVAWHRRKAKKERRTDGAPTPNPTPDVERAVAERQAAEVLGALLGELDAKQRDVFVMIELEQMAPRDVADTIGVKVNTVYSRLRLARAAMGKRVRRHAAIHEAAFGRASKAGVG